MVYLDFVGSRDFLGLLVHQVWPGHLVKQVKMESLDLQGKRVRMASQVKMAERGTKEKLGHLEEMAGMGSKVTEALLGP